jgi:hypothetical protein
VGADDVAYDYKRAAPLMGGVMVLIARQSDEVSPQSDLPAPNSEHNKFKQSRALPEILYRSHRSHGALPVFRYSSSCFRVTFRTCSAPTDRISYCIVIVRRGAWG